MTFADVLIILQVIIKMKAGKKDLDDASDCNDVNVKVLEAGQNVKEQGKANVDGGDQK